MLLCTETFRRPFVHLIFHFQDVLLSCVFFLLFSFELNLSCNAIILQHSVFYVCSIWKTHESKEKTSGAPALRNVQSHMKKKNVWNVVSHKLGINRSLFTKFSGIQFQRRVCIFIRLQQQMKFWFYDYVQNLHSAHTHTSQVHLILCNRSLLVFSFTEVGCVLMRLIYWILIGNTFTWRYLAGCENQFFFGIIDSSARN